MDDSDARYALLARLWDYAGQFPPAELPLADALAEWKAIRASGDAWLLNCFVARAGQDVDVEPLAIVDGKEERQGGVVYRETPPDAGAVAECARDGVRAKLRCGGNSVPSIDEVAEFIRACRKHGVVFKATAGLHHAVRTDRDHGFLNLLAACVYEGGERSALTRRDFVLTPMGFGIGRDHVGAEACARVRRDLFASIGSCSFAEPVGELKALGIL